MTTQTAATIHVAWKRAGRGDMPGAPSLSACGARIDWTPGQRGWGAVPATDRCSACVAAMEADKLRWRALPVERRPKVVPYGVVAVESATADLLDKAAIAHLAGTTPGQVDTWRFRPLVNHPPFPEPTAHFGGRPVWSRSDVAAWLAQPRPGGRPRKG